MRSLIFLTAFCAASALAESTYITMPGQGWTLKLDTPAITASETTVEGLRIKFMGSSTDTGITLSVHGEPEGAANNQTCFETFWGRGKANPTVIAATVSTTSDATAHYVTHQSEGVYRGQQFKTANGHAYFARGGLCMDLHVSHWPFSEGSEAQVSGILGSIEVIQD